MAKESITPEWIEDLPSKVTGPTKIMAESLKPGLHAAFDALLATVKETEGAGAASPREVAVKLWEESGRDDYAEVVPLKEKLIKVQNLLVETQAAYDEIVDKGISDFLDEATEASDQLKIAATNALVERRTALMNLLKVATGGQVDLPKIPGSGTSAQSGESAPRPDLASATVDGEPVIPANGQWPTMGDIHRVVSGKYNLAMKTRELSLFIFKTAKMRTVPEEGLTVNLTINDKKVKITMMPRAEADKPKRGKQAK